MGADYELTLHRPDGREWAKLKDYISLVVARATNGVGALTLVLPYVPFLQGYDTPSYPRDARLVIRRRPDGGSWGLVGDTVWFVLKAEKELTEAGEFRLVVTAYDANTLLTRRIVAYEAGSSQADKTGEADAVMKAVVRENLGSLATDTDRDWSDYISVDADLPAGTTPSVSKAFSRRPMLNVLQEVAQACFVEGTYLAFDMVAASAEQFAFRTFPGQRGQDHRWPDGSPPVILSPELGNLTSVEQVDDYTSEATFVYAGGQGEGADRMIATASDPTRIAASPFGRIELWKDSRNTETAAALQNEADAALRAHRPRKLFAAKVVDTPESSFGVHYGFGDSVTCDFDGVSVECRLDAFRLSVGANGAGEVVDINLRVEGESDGE